MIDEMTAKLGEDVSCKVMQFAEGDGIKGRVFCTIGAAPEAIAEFAGLTTEIQEEVAAVMPVSEMPTPQNGE